MLSVRAIYQNGQLELLEPVDLVDGEEVHIQIVDKEDILLDLMSDLIIQSESADEDELIDEDALIRQLDRTTKGTTLSDIVIDERRSGR